MFGAHGCIALVVVNGVGYGYQHADCDAAECETTNTRGPAAAFLEDYGKGSKHHVERAVDDGHVDGEEKDDRFAEEEYPGSREGF